MEQEKKKSLQERIESEATDNKLPCGKAFMIADELNVSKPEVGDTCNEMGVKIVNCQLGCF